MEFQELARPPPHSVTMLNKCVENRYRNLTGTISTEVPVFTLHLLTLNELDHESWIWRYFSNLGCFDLEPNPSVNCTFLLDFYRANDMSDLVIAS